ncbi:MAG: primosomal protein N' [Clostridia bacterium]|nr:primosomal protein N' [Clostridia bacterium]
MVAEVIINSSVKDLNKTFDYQIPNEMDVHIGSRVFIPFGRKKDLEEGIVIGLKEKSQYEIKEIAGLQPEQIRNEYVELAKWIADRYFCNISDSLKLMLPPGRTTKNVDKRIETKKINSISLAKDIITIKKDIEDGIIKTKKQIDVLEFLMRNDNSTMQDIELFTDGTVAVVNALVKKGYVEKKAKKVERNPFLHKITNRTSNLKLNDEQQVAFESIKDKGKYLIYGVTGSGKTEIYLQLIERNLKNNKSSIMLIPEISLTPQTVDRFISRFGEDEIAVLHSKLSTGERFDAWNRIKDGRAKIVIGARSAIFAPAVDLGMIIIDEEHDESYQSESTPRYDALEVADFLANKFEIPLVLGSATPDMKNFYKSNNGEIKKITLTERANESKLPDVEIVDLRNELANGNKRMLSESLQKAIFNNLKINKQTILFLNRRGFSTFVMCRDCGNTIKCKRCNITLTYHKDEGKLKCHYCGHEEKIATVCPECKSKNIKYFGAGTQRLEAEVKELFPEASTIRMDIDTVSKKNSHEEIINRFKNENINILVGTQMVVKGHHFPNVTLVGVISADSNLNMGDFRASEKTFQTLTQVAGRAGREGDDGKVIIQTYNPENYAIEYSKTQNYDLFYNTEIQIRKQLKYPPFCDIIVVAMSSKEETELNKVSRKIHKYLKQRVIDERFGLLLYSPVPSPINKIKDRYRARLIIKCKYDKRIHDLLTDAQNEFYKMKVKTARMSIELNPNNML